MVVEPIFGFLLAYPPVVAVVLYSIVVLFLINIFYRILIKQQAARELKAQTKEISKRMKEEQKAGNTDAATRLMTEMMQHNARLMRMTMKPMLISFIIVIILLPFLSSSYPDIHVGIKDNQGNFTLNGNNYDVIKEGSIITVKASAGPTIICESLCMQRVESNMYQIRTDNQDVKLDRVVALLPVAIPLIGVRLDWLGWYILVSIPLVILLRKLMKIYV